MARTSQPSRTSPSHPPPIVYLPPIQSRSPSPSPTRIVNSNGVVAPNPTAAPIADIPGKVEEFTSYVKRWQIWDKDNNRWIPFDPATVKVEDKTKQFPNADFVVNVRYKNAFAEPELVVSDFTDMLLGFLRATVGNQFFDEDPTYDVEKLFIELKDLRQKIVQAKELVASTNYVDIAKAVKKVEKLGFLEASKPTTTWIQCKAYLDELFPRLEPFMDYMGEQFAPIEKKLARMQEFGQMEFDLLPYHFELGQKIMSSGSAFVLTSRGIQSDWGGTRYMQLGGYGYRFDGDQYTMSSKSSRIFEFKGTRPVEELEARLLSEEDEAHLKIRGQLYTTFVGVHYKQYFDQRVIIDPKAYRNQDGYIRDPDLVIEPLADDLLYLLPSIIEGFNLGTKRFQMFNILHLNEVEFDENAWQHLVLDADTKLLVEALVKVTNNANTSGEIISDVITGKGGGLISVLHGPPGTGKTLTAESIAEHLHRPMYMVGFAELSTEPNDLERNLKRILLLATAWDAVLLIDEADVFLEQRSLHELNRNALVSVALRLLEYHRGVLFLTTNRITTFDEAFLSRFSICIKFNDLDQSGRFTVWRKFFELAGCVVESTDEEDEFTPISVNPISSSNGSGESHTISTREIVELAEKPFNGRTIKNLVRTSQALALSQEKRLHVDHVKTVVRVQEKFLREFAAIRQ